VIRRGGEFGSKKGKKRAKLPMEEKALKTGILIFSALLLKRNYWGIEEQGVAGGGGSLETKNEEGGKEKSWGGRKKPLLFPA